MDAIDLYDIIDYSLTNLLLNVLVSSSQIGLEKLLKSAHFATLSNSCSQLLLRLVQSD